MVREIASEVEDRRRLTDATEDEGNESPRPEPDKVDEVREGGQGEQGEKEVRGNVTGSVFLKDHHHGPVDHRTEGRAIVKRHWVGKDW